MPKKITKNRGALPLIGLTVLLVIVIVFTTTILVFGYSKLNMQPVLIVETRTTTPKNLAVVEIGQEGASKLITDEIDISNWLTYSNKVYGFKVKYPYTYTLDNRDIANPISQSRFIAIQEKEFNVTGSEVITIEVIHHHKEKDVHFHIGMTDSQYVNYIKDPNRYAKKDLITVGDQIAPIYFFHEENPGAFVDSRSTIVVIIEKNDTVLVIKKVPAFELDSEFKKILSSLQFVK